MKLFSPPIVATCVGNSNYCKKGTHSMKKFALIFLTGLSVMSLSACSNKAADAPADPAATTTETMADPAAETAAEPATVVALAQGNAATSTLVSAVTAAGLAETLSGPGPFTVFAPTNDAFAKVDKATLDGLMKPDKKEALGGILKYHVVAGKVMAADVVKMIADGKGTATIKTLNGNLKATMDGDKVILTDAKGGKSTITGTDLGAGNGVVHTIDTVLMP
jgi:uncharacterized surface protein with fasciclin (FAS1) repeats